MIARRSRRVKLGRIMRLMSITERRVDAREGLVEQHEAGSFSPVPARIFSSAATLAGPTGESALRALGASWPMRTLRSSSSEALLARKAR